MASTAEKWERVRDLFEGAIELAPAERERFIAAACDGDVELRAELESLLAHDAEAAERPLVPPTLVLDARAAADGSATGSDLVGTRIGQYEIRAVIASGGMGTVYAAEQSHPRRTVAIKVMRSALASKSALRRFHVEVEVLARLRHPNIAQVFEAGTHGGEKERGTGNGEQGRGNGGQVEDSPGRGTGNGERGIPYFVMEYVAHARTITEYFEERMALRPERAEELSPRPSPSEGEGDRLRPNGAKGSSHGCSGSAAQPMDHDPRNTPRPEGAKEPSHRPSPSAGEGDAIRAKLELFAKVCDAVHHGHQRGIVHRDLKPGNVLVDAAGEPRVIDFGVARATDIDVTVTQQTAAGDLVGTMQYMSPEQCDADPLELDFRSDVYSLGVMLYELLTGAKPYDATTTIFHATQVIKTQPPRPPSQIVRKLRGDVGTIVLKALEKDREKRYQSAAELRDDIRRYLNREPINARPPTRWTKAVRWIGRHPVWTTAAACLLVVLGSLTGMQASYWAMYERPDRIEISSKHSDARLFSYGGRLLHCWDGGSAGAVPFAALARELAIVGFSVEEDSELEPWLYAFDSDRDFRNPVWVNQITHADLPEALKEDNNCTAADFGVRCGVVVNCFPELPGDEIVVAFQHKNRTQTALRVCDFAGNVLYQVWLDFSIERLAWHEAGRILVIAGEDGRAYWKERGHPEVGRQERHPRVVFGLVPKNEVRRYDYVHENAGDPELRPRWYRCLMPPDLSTRLFVVQRNLTPDQSRRTTHVRIEFNTNVEPDAVVSWDFDANGKASLAPLGDGYKLRMARDGDDPFRLPPPEKFYWGDIPPIAEQPATPPSP